MSINSSIIWTLNKFQLTYFVPVACSYLIVAYKRNNNYIFAWPNGILVNGHDHLHHSAPPWVSVPASTQQEMGAIKSPS